MKLNGQLHAQEVSLVHNEKEAEWAPVLARTFWTREKYFDFAGSLTTISRCPAVD
jgi:hypothetical protein